MKATVILGIESSCDDTSAAILRNREVLANVIANQNVHQAYGGVVPELASRAHQANIIPVVEAALKQARIDKTAIDAIAFTRGPGLLGSLLVGTSFAKGFALASKIPLLDVNHLHGHILAHFLTDPDYPDMQPPNFPYLCLLVSGGHTELVRVDAYDQMETIGQTIDDAAGEAFDKAAKIMGLGYPGGPLIDKFGKVGNPQAFSFPKPQVAPLDFSFSGLKTSFLYFLRKKIKENPDFIVQHRNDLCASLQFTIIDILTDKIKTAVKTTGIREIAIGGGVSANSALRQRLTGEAQKHKWRLHLPPLRYTTDNAAMIALSGYFKYLRGEFASQSITPVARSYAFLK